MTRWMRWGTAWFAVATRPVPRDAHPEIRAMRVHRSRVFLSVLLLVAGVSLASGACSKKKSQSSESTKETTAAPDKAPTRALDEAPGKAPNETEEDNAVPAKGASGPGNFVPVHGASEATEIAALVREAKVLEDLTTELNQVIALPRDLTVAFEDCDEPNAFYDGEAYRITTCYELVALFHEMFTRELESGEEALEATLGATLFTLFHELGHALIHVLELPTTGKEEDAVDQLATLILAASGEDGELMALDGAQSFLLQSADSDMTIDELPFWDEHSLDEQRFYNIVCLIYGAAPEKYAGLVEDGDLPEERAELCPEDYQRAARAWDKILAPHLK